MNRFLAALLFLLTCSQAAAWNKGGHQVIGLLAWEHLSEEDRQSAVSLLRDHPRFDQHFMGNVPDVIWQGSAAEQDQWIFAFAGTWPDLVRSSGSSVTRDDVLRYSRPKWHYVNLPVYASINDGRALSPTLSTNRSLDLPDSFDDRDMNVAQAIGNSRRIVIRGHHSRADQAVHLCWLLHLIADAHQPCHSSAYFSVVQFPKGDRGGNQIPIRGSGGNLHAYWDQAIVPRSNYNRVRRLAAQLKNAPLEKDQETADVKAWLLESYKLAKLKVYTPVIREAIAQVPSEDLSDFSKIELDTDYFRGAGEAARKRAQQAGFRIANLLSNRLPAKNKQQSPTAFQRPPPEEPKLIYDPIPEPAPNAEAKDHWLNTKSNARHNRSCRWFGKTKRGRYCTSSEGHACGQCGG